MTIIKTTQKAIAFSWLIITFILLTTQPLIIAVLISLGILLLLILVKRYLRKRFTKPRNDSPIPEYIKKSVITRQRYLCGNCSTELSYKIYDLHHIVARERNGTNNTHNIVALCPNCHAKIHRS